MAKHSKYQQRIIRDYYQNREAISLQKVQEMVTDLYLAEGKSLDQKWKQVLDHLEKLGVAKSRLEQISQKRDPAMLAKLVEDLLSKK